MKRSKTLVNCKAGRGTFIKIRLLPKGVIRNDRIELSIKTVDGTTETIKLRQWEASTIVTGFSMAISALHSHRRKLKE